MKNPLSQLESRLQALIEGSAARLFPFGNLRKELSTRLVDAMKMNIHPQGDGKYWAPNLFVIHVNPTQAEGLLENPEILVELGRLLERAGRESGLTFPGAPKIEVTPDPQLGMFQSSIQAHFHVDNLVDTSILDSPKTQAEKEIAGAFLIVNGTDVFPLGGGMISVGRNASNSLVIDDPRVSRNHAQLRVIHGRYVIFDLGSTGGTYVNNQRITQWPLTPGDVISLAGVPLIFGQESNESLGATQEFPG